MAWREVTQSGVRVRRTALPEVDLEGEHIPASVSRLGAHEVDAEPAQCPSAGQSLADGVPVPAQPGRVIGARREAATD